MFRDGSDGRGNGESYSLRASMLYEARDGDHLLRVKGAE